MRTEERKVNWCVRTCVHKTKAEKKIKKIANVERKICDDSFIFFFFLRDLTLIYLPPYVDTFYCRKMFGVRMNSESNSPAMSVNMNFTLDLNPVSV